TTTTPVFLKTPLSAVTSSFLAARSTASSFQLADRVHTREPPVATRHPVALYKRRQDSAAEILPPRRRRKPHRVLEVRTARGALGPKTVFPVCAGDCV